MSVSGDSIYGLVCVGGGAHGAYQVGVIKRRVGGPTRWSSILSWPTN